MNMKVLSCFFICLVCSAYGWVLDDLTKYEPVEITLYSGLIKCKQNRSSNLDVSGIEVYFYGPQQNHAQGFSIKDAANKILSTSNLDKNKKFIIYVGGFMSSIRNKNEIIIKKVFRNVPNTYLIILDHSQYTKNLFGSIRSYERSVTYVHFIGKALGQMLAGLRNGGVLAKKIDCVGHSLGGQIIGQAGEEFFRVTGEKIKKITALDPAGPCFTDSSIGNQVRSGLAQYVEVYHCNSGVFGSASVLGDVDFFLNYNGRMQPICASLLLPGIAGTTNAEICSHNSCVDIWIESIINHKQFTAWKCQSYEQFKKGKCLHNDSTVFGFWNPGNATGRYYLSTQSTLFFL